MTFVYFLDARRRTRKRAHPHANSTTRERRGRKNVYASRLAIPLNKSFVRRESAKL